MSVGHCPSKTTAPIIIPISFYTSRYVYLEIQGVNLLLLFYISTRIAIVHFYRSHKQRASEVLLSLQYAIDRRTSGVLLSLRDRIIVNQAKVCFPYEYRKRVYWT